MRAAAMLLAFAVGAADAQVAPSERRSGYDFMSPETRAMQDDDVTNPAVFWLLDGEAVWNRKVGTVQKACADCHGDARTSMTGVAARHPAFDPVAARPMSLEQRIGRCRVERQRAAPLAPESRDLLSIAAFVARQSRGMPVVPDADPRAAAFRDAGRALFNRRIGQLNMSCAQCHDERWGKSLAGSPIPQAHPTGYPLYRLEWQALGSLQRRLRSCLVGVRAEPYAWGAPELVELELFLMARAGGMKMESPAVRP